MKKGVLIRKVHLTTPPYWKLRFPAHMRNTLKTPSGTNSEESEGSATEYASQTVGGSPTPVVA